MSDSVQMPALGESVTEGTVTRWLKNVGDRVEQDEPLLEVSTDKVDTEIPSPVAGVLEQILVGEDETVAVGTQLAVIGGGVSGAVADSGAAPAERPAEQPVEQPAEQAVEQPVEPAHTDSPAPQVQAATEPQVVDAPPTRPSSTEVDEPAHKPEAPAPADGADGHRVQMPALGESVTEGTVTRWLKAEGDTVEVDEPLLEVSTDKVDTEIPSPVAGVVTKILVAEDETVAVGTDLVVVGGSGGGRAATSAPAQEAPRPADQQPQQPTAQTEQTEQTEHRAPEPEGPGLGAAASVGQAPPPPAAPSVAPAPPPAPAPAPAPTPAVVQGADGAGYVTPLVRRMASDQGVDLSTLTGTGVGGRIRKQDVIDAAEQAKQAAAAADAAARAPVPEAPAVAPAPAAAAAPAASVSAKRGTTEKMSRLRKVIAQRMVESLQVSAQLTTVVEVDVTRIARLRGRAKGDFEAREGVKLSFLPFFALAAVEALKAYPVVNASIQGDEVAYHGEENLGVAVDTERGLLVPVIHGAGNLNIAGLARRIADLADRTRRNKVTPDELGGGTFTLTNTGSRGALFDTPIINQPQVAILGTGAVVKRPVVVTDVDGGETIAVRSMVYLALSYDHRIVDGADAARFLVTMKQRLEEGAFEADLGL